MMCEECGNEPMMHFNYIVIIMIMSYLWYKAVATLGVSNVILIFERFLFSD